VQDTDPEDTYWCDTSATNTAEEIADQFSSVINSNFGDITASVNGVYVTIVNSATGEYAVLTNYFFNTNAINGVTALGGTGNNATPDSGGIEEVTIISQSGTKTIIPVRIFALGAGVNVEVEIALKVGSTYYPIVTNLESGYVSGEPVPLYSEWASGRASASLVARMVGTVPMGGSQTILAVVEQIL
jgi:hypothetical protein